MRSLFLAVMLMASMLFVSTAIAAPKHTPAKHGQVDASKTANQADEVPPAEPVDTSWKGQLGAIVISMGGATLAGVLHVHPAYIAIAVIAVVSLILLWILFIVVRALMRLSQRGPKSYAGDFSNSIHGKKREPRAETNVKPNIKPLTARAAQQIAKSQAAARDHADFDVTKFLRSANSYFLRLQTAWDRGDLNDLKEFVTREIYDELKSQIRARGAAENKTGVDSLDVELLKLESGDGKYVATVKFSGLMREEDSPASKFMEVWSLTRRIESKNWRLAGIQQFA
jgi:predicted lipid-binding transport protein (Tim44 family)